MGAKTMSVPIVSAPQDVIPTCTYSPVSSTQKAGPPESPCDIRHIYIKALLTPNEI